MPRRLLKSQRIALARSRGRKRVAFYLEMRLGKTLAAIRWAKRHGRRRVLVVCPLSVLKVWEQELAMEGIRTVNLRTLAGMGWPMPDGFYLINYELLRKRRELTDLYWDCVILDESTTIRNPKSAISKLVTVEFPHVQYRAILSGYPAPESLLDLFQQFKFLHNKFLGFRNYYGFRNEFYNRVGHEWFPKSGTIQAIRDEMKRLGAVTLTRKQAGIGERKVYETRYVELPRALAADYRKAEREFAFGDELTKWRVVVDSWLGRIAGGEHKDAELAALLSGDLRDVQSVVWFRFNAEIERVAAKLADMPGVGRVATVTGQVPPHYRGKLLKDFNAGTIRHLLIQERIGKFGLDLSAADTAIIFSQGYEGETRHQKIDRIVHPQKKRPLLILDLVTVNTVDEDILDAIREKDASGQAVMRHCVERIRERLQRN